MLEKKKITKVVSVQCDRERIVNKVPHSEDCGISSSSQSLRWPLLDFRNDYEKVYYYGYTYGYI